jgi:hypothetical protein
VADPELATDMRRKAEALVAAAAESGETLDYSLASLLVLDALLDRLFARRWPIGRAGRLDVGKFERMIEPVGAYVGETLRREGGGAWGVHEESGPGLELPSGTWTFPLAKARKRFENGHEDGLAFYAQMLLGR